LYIAECAVHSLHNIITLRGAQVRDAKAWSQYLDESLVLFGKESDVMLAGHAWPTWGHEDIAKFIGDQRDLYAYIHDQTVRLMNHGMTGIEIAEHLSLPPSLQRSWFAQGFYGSVSHNVKGIYQRYLGWFDGNPAHLWEHPPKQSAKRYVECMGGIDEVVRKAERFVQEGDLRFAATLLDHAVTFDPSHTGAKTALASVFTKLGHGSENGTWRNFYLTGALALLAGNRPDPRQSMSAGLRPEQSVEQWFALLSIQLDGIKAAEECFSIHFHLTDDQRWWRVNISNGALTYRDAASNEGLHNEANLTVHLKRLELLRVLSRGNLEGTSHEGNVDLINTLLSLMEGSEKLGQMRL
jgi:alkyl sulfatase BDS1-like metallo-beta-lactamase superfamily hydrolase